MAQVIDSLVVTLGLDTSGFKKGANDADDSFKKLRDNSKRTGSELEENGKQAANFFGIIQGKAVGLIASLVGLDAVKDRVVAVTGATADLGRTAAVTGANIQQLAAFGNVIARNGGNAAAATAQIQGFIQTVERFKVLGQASPEFQQFLGTIGAGANDTWLDDLKKFADFAEKNKNDPAKVALIASLGGITDNATVSELLKGRSSFDADLERSRQLGVAEQKDADAARTLQEKFGALGQAADGLARKFSTDITPGLGKFLDGLTELLLGGKKPTAASLGLDPSRAPRSLDVIAGAGFADFLYGIVGSSDPSKNIVVTSPSKGSGGGTISSQDDLLALVRRLEGSKDDAVSKPAFPGSRGGAVGRYQITPATAKDYGFDPSRLKDPVYNERVARAILADLSLKYGGNIDDILIGYNSTPSAVSKFNKSGGNLGVLLPETQAYLRHAAALAHVSASDKIGGAGDTNISETHIDTINVNAPQATDAQGIAGGIRGALANNTLANQANVGLQ